MSGSIFGNVPQVHVPDFGATLARAQGVQANRLAMLAQQRQMEEADQRQQFFAQNAPGFASADPAKRMNLLAMLGTVPGGAAMALPMMDQERRRAELRDIMSDGMPSAAPVVQPAPQGGYIDRLVQDESGGRPDARNPRSSATGAAQFIDSTWLQFAQANPQLFQGMSREQVLAARSDQNLSRQAAEWYRRENLSALSGQGLPANDGTAALAHRFGPQGAAALLRADQNAPIAGIVGPQVMAANPDLNGRTVGQVVGRYAQRFGGDTIPAQTGAATPAAASGNDQRIAILQRRAERLMAAGYQQEAQSTLALIQSLRRGESEPLERVRRPDGNEVLVPRSQASGMVSAPNPRETPGPFGSGERGRSLQAIEELGQVIARGEATPEQLMRYGSAVTNYQQEEIRPDGSRVTPRLPPYAPPLDWVAQRYPSFQFNAQAAAPGQPPPAAPAAQPGAAPMGDATPAAPTLPPAGASPGLPGAGGTVSRDPAAMEGGTRRQIEEQIVANQDAISRLAGIRQGFRPEYQTLGNRWSNMWSSFREMGTGRLGAQEQQRLREYTQYRAGALENLNRTIQETTGAAMGAEEARRITATMPNPGTGLFDGDSPTEFQAKLDRATDMLRSALIRRHYSLSRGLNPTQTGIELSDIPRLYMRRAGEIEREIRQDNADIPAEELSQRTRARLRQEFGV